jgi:hypothetical protein
MKHNDLKHSTSDSAQKHPLSMEPKIHPFHTKKYRTMATMRSFFAPFIAFFLTIIAVDAMAQSNPYGDYYRDDQNGRTQRYQRRCTEPYAVRLFNRDYPSLANSSLFHLDKELRNYVKYRCLSSEQIRRLAVLYQTDREKYDFLVYGLTYVFDVENYAMTGSTMANRNARDGFYRFLVREGIPAGDYYNNNFGWNGNGCNPCNTCPPNGFGTFPIQQGQMQQPPQDNTYNNYPDPRNDQQWTGLNSTPQFGNGQNSVGVNSGFQGLMTVREFEILKEQVKRNSFDTGKMDAAKSATSGNVLTAAQVAELARLFNFDNNRLEYAKFAYQYTYDKQNYNAVSNAIAFESNRKELEKHVRTGRN